MKRTALVTGSSKGIGRAVAARLARDGHYVLVHYHQDGRGAEETLAHIRAQGGDGQIVQFDVTDLSGLKNALSPFAESGIHVLVNNAGIIMDSFAAMMPDHAFENVLNVNTVGPFYLMRFCLKPMMRLRQGCIVNITALSGHTGNRGQINYAASKAALTAMTKTLAAEVGSWGIRVNAVAPGLIETDMIKKIPQLDELKKQIPLGRLGSADDVAGAVAFLCSKDADYITGTCLHVNGGIAAL